MDESKITQVVEKIKERFEQGDMPDLRSELISLLNRYSRENISNTPDFILRDYIWDALEAFERGVRRRDKWYGISPEPGKETVITTGEGESGNFGEHPR